MGFEAVGFDFFLKVIVDMFADGLNSLRCLNKNSHFGSSLSQIIPVLFTQISGDLLISLINGFLVNVKLNINGFEIE